jgi:NADH-ubiquinone oxidoreductase chain 6
MKTLILEFLAFACIISSILVITSRNPVIAVIYLISVFINAACYLLMLGIGFIGLTYLLLYVGAITILFLFVIMSINIKLTDIMEAGTQYTQNIPLAISIGIFFIYELVRILPYSILSLGSNLGSNVPLLNYPIKAFKWINDQFILQNSSNYSNNIKTQVESLLSEEVAKKLFGLEQNFDQLKEKEGCFARSQMFISEGQRSPLKVIIEDNSSPYPLSHWLPSKYCKGEGDNNLGEIMNYLTKDTLNNSLISINNTPILPSAHSYNETIDGILSNLIQLSSLGQELYTHGVSWLIICGIILLLSLLCPTIITRSPRYPYN